MFLKFSCSGPKYEFAKKWKIHIVKSDWLYDSIEKGYCLEEKQFALAKDAGEKSEVKTSTPEKESGPRGKGLIRVGGIMRKCSGARVIYIGTLTVNLLIQVGKISDISGGI